MRTPLRGPVVLPLFLAIAFVVLFFQFVLDLGPLSGLSKGYKSGFWGLTPQHVAMEYTDSLHDTDIDVWADEGRRIVVDYRLTVEKGSLWIGIWGPRGWIQRWATPLGPIITSRTLRTSGSGRLVVPATGSGFYRFAFSPVRLTGSLDATVDME